MPQFLDLVVAIYIVVFLGRENIPPTPLSFEICFHLSSLVSSSKLEWIPRSSLYCEETVDLTDPEPDNVSLSLMGYLKDTCVVIWGIARIYHQIQLKIPSNNFDFVRIASFIFFNLSLHLITTSLFVAIIGHGFPF